MNSPSSVGAFQPQNIKKRQGNKNEVGKNGLCKVSSQQLHKPNKFFEQESQNHADEKGASDSTLQLKSRLPFYNSYYKTSDDASNTTGQTIDLKLKNSVIH